MDHHFKSSDRPLFVYIQTMASHGPYDSAYMPEENVPGGGPGTSAEMSEYLRRAAMASRDRDFLMDEIKRRFPDEPILVVRYGDHQPSATRDLINDVWGDDSPDVGANGSPGPFITFYAMAGHNLFSAATARLRPARYRLFGDGDARCRRAPALRGAARAQAADGGV